ncbi:MAG: DUF4397 domain-containing protein [Lachnospiraceae bacterium]|nr:DUF4397 domain-containing protein [Lachnospiraceae bacterium]
MNRDYFTNNDFLQMKPAIDMAQEDVPTTPLPNPGEGGAVYPGDEETGAVPVTPLPNEGEGGAVFPGNMFPENNRPSMPGRPNMPTPGMGENRPPMTGGIAGIIGTIISSHPRPNEPCRFCAPNINRTGMIRFLNAATGYNPFIIYVNENIFSEDLNFAELTDYENVSVGSPTITIMGDNGYIFIQKQIEVKLNDIMTLAIVNTDNGLDLQMIMDEGCTRGSNLSCIRAANFAYNSGSLSVNIGNQRVNFPILRYRAVANFEQIWPSLYVYTVSRDMTSRLPGGSNILLAAPLNVQADRNYTIYLLNWKTNSSDTIKALIVEDM